MNHVSLTKFAILFPLILVGCGGGGSDSSEPDDKIVITEPLPNTAPIAVNDNYSVDEGKMLIGNIITDTTGGAADSDVDGDTITVTQVNGINLVFANDGFADVALDNNTLRINIQGDFEYTNAHFEPGDAASTYIYTVSDGEDTSIGTVTIAVTDIPVISIPVDTEGFFTEPRFALSAQACITSLSDESLTVDDGFDESTLASNELSCTQSNDGNNLIYSMSWSGTDFNRDDEKDTLTFDVRVEAFTGSTFSYSELAGQSSMTALGTSSTFSHVVNDEGVSFWDIDGDTGEGITEGQSLRFSVENIEMSLDNYRVVFNGFNGINVIETRAGHSHSHIRGEGAGLNSGITNGTDQFIFDPFNSFVITGSGDSSSVNIWGISNIHFSFSIDNPDLTSVNSAEWLAGSWGVTFPVFGGERLDDEIATNNYDYRAGAQEIIDELPTVGHIITNLSYFAHSHYFTLRGNTNVDIANEIHESLVPTLENEQIILDVLQKFKEADKRIILYISTNYLLRASDETQAAWEAYYNTNFAGDEYLAYEHLIEGFVERFKDYADGYWLDTATLLSDDGKLNDFIHMIKQTDPTSIVTANVDKNYFSEGDEFLFIDSDGLDDTDESDYKIVLHEPLNTFQDFTNGHVTPLSTGAPPNSWGYEEYTLPNMINEPWATYNGKTTFKHGWFPIRELWHSPRQLLVFDVEQAYRFVKSVTDGEASITFATTNADHTTSGTPGYLMPDEMDIMKEINARLMMETPPAHEVYVRPEGASLLVVE